MIASRLRTCLAYVLPLLAAALYSLVVLDAKYHQGWVEAQGCRPEQGCTLGGFDYVGFGIIGLFVFASFTLVARGRPRWGNGLGLVLALLGVIMWLGMHG